jgi:DNA-binding transcriptional LysR family regulator
VTSSSTGHAAHEQLEKVLLGRLSPENIQLRVPSFVSSAFVVYQSDVVGSMPERLAIHFIKQLPLEMLKPPLPMPRFDIAQVWHERFNRDAGHRWLRARVFDLFGPRRRG